MIHYEWLVNLEQLRRQGRVPVHRLPAQVAGRHRLARARGRGAPGLKPRGLPARHGGLRAHSARSAAGPAMRADRRAVRHQLRGGRGEHDPPRRPGLRVPADGVRLRAAPRRASGTCRSSRMYEYGSRVGFWRLHRLFTAQASRSPSSASRWRSSGTPRRSPHGRGGLGDREPRLPLDRPPRHAGSGGARAHPQGDRGPRPRLAGSRPLGHFLGRRSENTVRLVAEEGGFVYSQDSYADELPYWVIESGRPLLMIPYTADVNDHRFTTTPGFDWGAPFFEYLRDTFDALYEEGERSPRLMNVGLHSRLVGRAGRFGALRGSSITCRATTASGSPAGSTSPSTGASDFRHPCNCPPRTGGTACASSSSTRTRRRR